MSPREWDALRWYERDLFIEGLIEEGLISGDTRASSTAPPAPGQRPGERLVSEKRHAEGNHTVIERDYAFDPTGAPGEFASMGFAEQDITG